MSWTKRQIIEQALEEIGLAAYAYDVTAEELRSAVRRLDSMMAEWDSAGIALGFPITDNPTDSDLDAVTNLPYFAQEAVFTSLAVKIAPSFGKMPSQETKAAAFNGRLAVINKLAVVPERQLPSTLPRGAGHKAYGTNRSPFFNRPNTDPLRPDANGELDITE